MTVKRYGYGLQDDDLRESPDGPYVHFADYEALSRRNSGLLATNYDLRKERDRMEHASSCAVHNEPALPAGPCDCQPIPQPRFRPRQVVVVSLLQLNYRGRVQSVSWDGFEWRVSVEYADDKGDLQTRQFYQDELVGVR